MYIELEILRLNAITENLNSNITLHCGGNTSVQKILFQYFWCFLLKTSKNSLNEHDILKWRKCFIATDLIEKRDIW